MRSSIRRMTLSSAWGGGEKIDGQTHTNDATSNSKIKSNVRGLIAAQRHLARTHFLEEHAGGGSDVAVHGAARGAVDDRRFEHLGRGLTNVK